MRPSGATTRSRTAPVTNCSHRGVTGAKPIQRPRPPILLGAHSEAGLDRIARRANGWLPFGVPLDEVERQWATLRMAERHGRNSNELQLVVRADPRIDSRPTGRHRAAFTGSCTELMGDIERTRQIGATELILDLHASGGSVDEVVGSARCLSEPTLAAT